VETKRITPDALLCYFPSPYEVVPALALGPVWVDVSLQVTDSGRQARGVPVLLARRELRWAIAEWAGADDEDTKPASPITSEVYECLQQARDRAQVGTRLTAPAPPAGWTWHIARSADLEDTYVKFARDRLADRRRDELRQEQQRQRDEELLAARVAVRNRVGAVNDQLHAHGLADLGLARQVEDFAGACVGARPRVDIDLEVLERLLSR
jgi:hypothetical protein